jgi:phosphatidylinositol alpha-1,6-mannosyltransferase
MPSLLVTNDFPPKVGGIQSYLWELWRRLPPEETTVLTTPYDGAAAWDAEQAYRVVRARRSVLLPTPALARDVDALAREVRADVIFLDPMLPLGLVGPRLRAAPYVVVAHGAEITLPGTLPVTRPLGRRVVRGAAAVVAAGGYPAEQIRRVAGREVRGVVIPPGVDGARFRPVDAEARAATRARLGVDPDRPLVLGLSRLDAVRGIPGVQLLIAGVGRDLARLRRLAGGDPDVHFAGRVPEADLPAVYACADVFAMCCRDRWMGLEAEGFGIVFLEAAACGVPAVAGRSGGAHEAVADAETGFVVAPRDVDAVRRALRRWFDDPGLLATMGRAARARAVEDFAYDGLVRRLLPLARGDFSATVALGETGPAPGRFRA